MSGQVAGINLSDPLVVLNDSHSEDWMPRVICLLRVNGEITTVLALGARSTADEMTDRTQDLVRARISDTSFWLNDERRGTKIGIDIAGSHLAGWELESAREVQQRFLPSKLPSIDGLDYYGESQPVGAVGGDFFDFLKNGNSSLVLSIGDVSGKGIPSALVMAAVQGSFRALESDMDFDLVRLMHNLNRMVWQLTPDAFFATMFCAIVDVHRGEMQYVNAGHDRVLLLAADKNRTIRLDSTGTALGLSSKTVFERRKIRLEPGNTLVAVTDGITEATDLGGYAFDRAVLDGIREHANGSARDLAEHIIKAAQRQRNGEPEAPSDDQTVVVVRFVEDMIGAGTHATVPIKTRTLAFTAGR
jgi:sigma-B regulation protein RsbU (phosphoserine phosphatase)